MKQISVSDAEFAAQKRVTRCVQAWVAFEAAGTALVLGGFALIQVPIDFVSATALLALLGPAYQLLMHAGGFWLVPRNAGTRH